jgi:hypothetical protein
LAAHYFSETEMPVLFQQRHQARQSWQEAFGTHVVCCLPGHKEGLLHRWTVLRQTTALDALLVILPVIEQLDGIFAGTARPFHKPIQQECFLGRGCLLVAWSQTPEQRAPGLKAR